MLLECFEYNAQLTLLMERLFLKCILSAAKLFSHINCPFLGVNLGKVGFMADLDSENLATELPEVLSGNNLVEDKEAISCSYNGKKYTAFNEIVLHTQKSYKLMHFELKIEGNLIYRKRADGLIISTSNGSTAYSLSAGGPILSPDVNGLVITSLNLKRAFSEDVVFVVTSEKSGEFDEEFVSLPNRIIGAIHWSEASLWRFLW